MKLSQVLITYSMSHQPSEKGFIPNFELLWYTLSQVNVCVLTSPVVLFLNLRITAPGFPVQTAVYETFVTDPEISIDLWLGNSALPYPLVSCIVVCSDSAANVVITLPVNISTVNSAAQNTV